MKNKFLVGSDTAFLCIFSACLLNLLIMGIVLKIVDMFVALDFFAQIVVRLVVSVITVSGISSAVRYFVAYRSAEFNISLFSGNYVVAALIQLVFSLLLKFTPFVAGGTIYLAGIFEHGTYFTSTDDIEYIGLIDYLAAFIILTAITYALNILFGIIGKKKRINDRNELLCKNEDK